MPEENFFEEPTEKSLVKAEIVVKYFDVWSNVMISTLNRSRHPNKKLAYCDLFSGPGKYENGTPSTPLLIIKQAIRKPALKDRLVTIFNDASRENISVLKAAIEGIPGIETLRYQPQFFNEEIGEKIEKIVSSHQTIPIPTLFFIDPFGYKGFTQKLLRLALKGWGCDCIFLFNYNRIRITISNPLEKIIEHINQLLGEKRADDLREQLYNATPSAGEKLIREKMAESLIESGAKHVLPFCFKFAADMGRDRTSHYIVLATKDDKGLEIMMDITGFHSSETVQGIPTYEFKPELDQQLSLVMDSPFDDLKKLLLDKFAGRTITVTTVISELHSVRMFRTRDTKNALSNLADEGDVLVLSPRRKGTMGNSVLIEFPKKGK